jgi:hypothetical protein
MILAALLLASAAGPAPCSGYYSLVPKNDVSNEVPFSLQIMPGKVHKISMDYGGFETPVTFDDHGAANFIDPNNQDRYYLACDASGANVAITASDGNFVRRYRLMRTRTDIWGVAKARHWPIGD